ncbi:PSME3-interacting protein [Tripterygium wilfordii]|uniref:PSME3-interacting protein n=1 Tax=Tripterygium wilfordii TaxID=458696 RepID=UPI0018F7EF41|nr:PSME3-interacting protein [Tripterygium wilfordii]
MAEELPPPIRLMNFVSEEQLDESKKTRGERVEDGTAQRDRPLFEILKENKDKRDAEFNERFKHRPPKALDEDETEFLEKLEASRREYEQQMADEDAQQLRSFQAAVAAQATTLPDAKTMPTVPIVQEQKPIGKKNSASRPLSMIVKVKPQAKKARTDAGNVEEETDKLKRPSPTMNKSSNTMKMSNDYAVECHYVAKSGLVSYSDESGDDD